MKIINFLKRFVISVFIFLGTYFIIYGILFIIRGIIVNTKMTELEVFVISCISAILTWFYNYETRQK